MAFRKNASKTGENNRKTVEHKVKHNPLKKGPTPNNRKVMSQAERVYLKFGGPSQLAKALTALSQYDPGGTGQTNEELKRATCSVYRWNYSKHRNGSEGVIPTRAVPLVAKAARLWGVLLDESDFLPYPIKVSTKYVEPDE